MVYVAFPISKYLSTLFDQVHEFLVVNRVNELPIDDDSVDMSMFVCAGSTRGDNISVSDE